MKRKTVERCGRERYERWKGMLKRDEKDAKERWYVIKS